MSGTKVLICGASIAGPATAYWLLKAGITDITIVEKAESLRQNGQSIDIRNSAVGIMQKMGIEAAVREKCTQETGLSFVNSKGKVRATWEATGETSHQSFTSEFEIFRGDFSEIIYSTVKDRVKTIFGEHVTSLSQEGDGVLVEFANGTKPQKYDLVVGADGLGSKTRAMALQTTSREHVKSLSCYLAYYTMKDDLLNGDTNATWYNAPGGRVILLRPDPTRVTRANLGICAPKNAKGRAQMDELLAAEKQGQAVLKDKLAQMMRGAGYVSERAIEGMYEADDFYSSEAAQVRTDRLSEGRIALVGDAGGCPSPFTGMGTSLALIGAYMLAGEVARRPSDVPGALKAYSERLLPIVRGVQKLPPFIPHGVNPQSQWAIDLRNFIAWAIVFFRIDVLLTKFTKLSFMSEDSVKLPDYEWKA